MSDLPECPQDRKAHPKEPADDGRFQAFLAECRAELEAKQRAFAPLMRESERWFYDLATCRLCLDAAEYRITPIGTYSSEFGTWLWAWANEDFPEEARNRSAKIRDLFATIEAPVLIQPGRHATLEDALSYSALAIHHLNAAGLFRCGTESPLLFLAVHERCRSESGTDPFF